MGQSVVRELPIEFVKEAHMVKELAVLTYDEFRDKIKELNIIFQQLTDANGKSLLFMIKGGSDSSVLWKGTVRIACIRIIRSTKKIEDHKLLNLKQFLQAYKMIVCHIKPMLESQQSASAESAEATSSPLEMRNKDLSASMILKKIATDNLATEMEECCICMERMPEVTLPCAHSYCLFCIEQWNVSHKTCPVCREALENTDETWVLPEIPESSEVNEELQKALTGLASKLPEDL